MMERNYYEIDETMAKQAQSMWSFSDYVMGSKTEEYRKLVDEAYHLADEVANKKPERAEEAYILVDRYAKKLANNLNASSRMELMCPSVMLVGAAKFPVQKKEKQNKARERNQEEYEKIQNYLNKIKDLLYKEEKILIGDKDVISKLQKRLDSLLQQQEKMKEVNAYYRKQKTLHGCPNLTKEEIESLQLEMQDPSRYTEKPYLSWQLTENGQKIRKTRKRLASLKAAKEKESSEQETNYFKVVENTERMRLQLFFDEKPEIKIRELVKQRGFRWSPKNQCWQRQLTNNARYALQSLIETLDRMVEEQKKI